MIVSEGDNRALYDSVQEKNLLRQYDLLTNCVEIGLKQGHAAFDKYTLWALNHAAVANIAQFGGRFREACAEAAKWPDDVKIAVNLSPVQSQSMLAIISHHISKTYRN